MLNYRVALCYKVKFSVNWVVDSDLLWAHMQLTIDCLIYKSCAADTPYIYLTVSQIFRINWLDFERKVNSTVFQVLNNDILFTKIFRFGLSNFLAIQILDT